MTVAHQRIIREQLAANPERTLFGLEGADVNTDLAKAECREIDETAAAAMILKYEWLGTMPMFVRRCFGLFHDGVLSGALVFAEKPGANLAANARSPIPAETLYLARGACAFWAHPHAASWMIARVCRTLSPCTVLAYADSEAGEIGTIYQALGWWYLGASEGGPSGFRVDGVRMSTRSVIRQAPVDTTTAHLFADTADSGLFVRDKLARTADTIRSRVPTAAAIVPIQRKNRYVGVYGDRRFKKAITRRLRPFALPYPKREDLARGER